MLPSWPLTRLARPVGADQVVRARRRALPAEVVGAGEAGVTRDDRVDEGRLRVAGDVDPAATAADLAGDGGVAADGAGGQRQRPLHAGRADRRHVEQATAVDAGRVGGDRAVDQRRRAAEGVHAAAAGTGGVAADGAVGERHLGVIGDAAAVVAGGVAADGAVGERQVAGIDDAAAAVLGGVAADGAAGEGQVAVIRDAAAEGGGAAGEAQSGERGGHALVDPEDPAQAAGVDGQARGRAGDRLPARPCRSARAGRPSGRSSGAPRRRSGRR